MELKDKLWMAMLLMSCGILLAGCQGEESSAPAPLTATVENPPQAGSQRMATTPIPPATDEEIMALASKNNCFFCHDLDQTVMGPAWRDVAKKYRGDPGAQAWLESKILNGGGGVWGNEEKMPAHPQLTAEQRAQLARFVLNLK